MAVVVAGSTFGVVANVVDAGVEAEDEAMTAVVLLPSPAGLAPAMLVPLLLTPHPLTAPSTTKPAVVPMPHLRSCAARMMPIPPRTQLSPA